ncbi:MAG: sortase [Chloroflexi bacterium]|nr:sortase [Chloroflexota bacterium]
MNNLRPNSGTAAPIISTPDLESLALYPGSFLPFQSWVEPWAAPGGVQDTASLVQGFRPVAPGTLPPLGDLSTATRMLIPSIDVDATVSDLAIRDLGDSREYETPNRVVGHIPTTGNPGEAATGWYFGHLQSPFRDEGAVFRALPAIPDLLRKGEQVYVVLESHEGSYLYEVYGWESMHQDKLRVTQSSQATIVLVTCIPEWTYDYRLLVKAELVGFKPAS